MTFKASSLKTPCPICGRTTQGCIGGKEPGSILCRIGNTFSPFFGRENLKLGTVINGLACTAIDETADCPYALFVPDKERECIQTRRWEYSYSDGRTATRIRHDFNYGPKDMKWARGTKPNQLLPLWYDQLPAAGSGELIFLAEGETCAEALRDLGFTATSVPNGSDSYKGEMPDLERFRGNQLVLCPDRDRVGVECMLRIAAAYPDARWMLSQPSATAAWETLSDRYDIADWVQDGATADAVHAAIQDDAPALPVVPWWEALGKHHGENGQEVKLTHAALDELISAKFSGKLRLNLLSQNIEWGDETLPPSGADFAYRKFSAAGIKVSKVAAIDAILQEAEINAYHPVRDYMESLQGVELINNREWLEVANHLIGGAYSPEHNSLFRKWLVAAVARAYNPGCKFEFAVVLAGGGGIGKTEMFRKLASPAWFGEGFEFDDTEQNTMLKLHKKWINEMGEVDGTTTKRESTKLKNFITRKEDDFRRPYARATESVKRSCVLCATTNKADGFLVDNTGNRRFVIYEVENVIDLDRIAALRDSIWATARRDYLAGEDWGMDANELAKSEDENQSWMLSDPWQDVIGDWLDNSGVALAKGNNGISVRDVLLGAMKLEDKQQDKKAENRAAAALKVHGWCNKKTTKKRLSRWFPEPT